MLTFDKFIETVDRLEEAQILLAALQFKVFTHLEKKQMTAGALAKKAGASKEGMEPLLNSLVTLEALCLNKGKYSNTSEMYRHFCETSPEYKKGMVMLRRENYDEYGRLVEIIRKGRKTPKKREADSPAWRRLFTFAMHERSEGRATQVASRLCKKKIGRLLDLGSGPGSYSAAILKKDKKAEATLLDRPAALKVAKELWGETSLNKRMEMKPGDLFDTDFGKGYDTVLFSNILHIYNESENRRLLKKIRQALNPGGRVVLLDFFLNNQRTGPYHASMFSLTMLLFTETGRTYTWNETETMLKRAGFGKLERVSFKDDSGLLIGTRV